MPHFLVSTTPVSGFSCHMSSSDEQKPQYFANGDFEKAVADIILTPRRSRLNYEQNESLFQFTDKQRDYYTKCFRYLLKTTQVIKIGVLQEIHQIFAGIRLSEWRSEWGRPASHRVLPEKWTRQRSSFEVRKLKLNLEMSDSIQNLVAVRCERRWLAGSE